VPDEQTKGQTPGASRIRVPGTRYETQPSQTLRLQFLHKGRVDPEDPVPEEEQDLSVGREREAPTALIGDLMYAVQVSSFCL
jgi:hypothetical protein